MKIIVTIAVELSDPDEWTETFGVEKNEVRRDVKSYIGNGVQQYGVFGDGEVTADITWQ